MIAECLDRPIAFQRTFVTITGSITSALFLSQAVYWARRCSESEDGERWFYKTQSDWEDETGMTRYEQEGARKVLRGLGLLKEKRVGIPAKLFFSVDLKKLNAAIMSAFPSQPSMRKTSKLVSGKPANSSAENQQSITENTTEITTETESKSVRADAPPTAEQKLSSSPHHGTGEHKKQTATKGTRLPDDWTLPDQWRTFAIGQGLSPQAITREADIFADYWRSIPGAKAVKLDWFATWRNWIRKIATQPVNQDHRRRASPPDSVSRPRAFGE